MNKLRKAQPHLAASFNASGFSQKFKTSERIHRLLEDAVSARASDIHFDPNTLNYCIRFRIDGVLHDVTSVDLDEGEHFIRYFRTQAELESPRPYEPQNGRIQVQISGQTWELRFSSAPAILGDKLALRLLNPEQLEKKISDLGMSEKTLEAIKTWTEDSVGMLLVAGPAGSGKTTTLYALLHELKMREQSTVTIEDPVEYRIDGITQIQVNEHHGMTFAEGLKIMLRLDPNYMLVGEIRDRLSAATAIDATGAGRILMSTLHSRDAIGVITMLRNYGIEDHEIATALEMVVAQRLVRRLCEQCKKQDSPLPSEIQWLTRIGIDPPNQCWRAMGCEACDQTGYLGRLGIFEVWRLNDQYEQDILRHANELSLRKTLSNEHHPLLLQDGLLKAEQGLTTFSELQGTGTSSQGYLLKQQEEDSVTK